MLAYVTSCLWRHACDVMFCGSCEYTKATGHSRSSHSGGQKFSRKLNLHLKMDHLFYAFMSRRVSTPSFCDDMPGLYKKKRIQKRASLGCLISSRLCPSSDHAKGISELENVMDEQLMQIREKIAAFRQQDAQLRERLNSLSDSVNKLTSRSSVSSSPSECSDLDSLDEVSEAEELEESEKQTTVFTDNSLLIPITTEVSSSSHFNRAPVRCFHTRQSSDPSSLHSCVELPGEEVIETRTRHSTYSTDQAINLYAQ